MAMSVTYATVNGRLMMENRGGVKTAYVSDTLGNLIQCRDASGNKTYEAWYWSYGEIRTSTGSNPSPWGFVGLLGYYTDALNYLYVRARYYRPNLTRWQTVDPLWPLGLPYYYCEGAPTGFVDPEGKAPHGGPKSPSKNGCTPAQLNKIEKALDDFCKKRLKYITNKAELTCAQGICNDRPPIYCHPQSDKFCSINSTSYPGYKPPPGFMGSGHACSYSAGPGQPPNAINLCPDAFLEKGCGCLGSKLLWEALNNCDKHTRHSDAPLCPLANSPSGPYGPKRPPCPS